MRSIVCVHAGRIAAHQPPVLLSGPVALSLQRGRHHVQLDGRHLRHVPVAGRGRQRPATVLPRHVQQRRVLRADRVTAERVAERRRPDRALRRVRPAPVRPAAGVPIVRHGHGRQRRDVLRAGVPGRSGLLEHRPAVRARHAGHAAPALRARQLPQRPEGGQGARAARLDAQQRAAQVPVR